MNEVEKYRELLDSANKQVKALRTKVAELEASNNKLKQPIELEDRIIFSKTSLKINNLEQRAKGVYDVRATTGFWNLSTCALRNHLRKYEIILQNKAKGLGL
jgi:hypothetical protein